MKHLKFTKNKQLLAIVLSVLLVGGCSDSKSLTKDMLEFCEADDGDTTITVTISTFQDSVAISCKLKNKAT